MLPQVKYVPHECNRVAHELALIGSMSAEGMPSVMVGVLVCMMHLVSNDCGGLVA